MTTATIGMASPGTSEQTQKLFNDGSDTLQQALKDIACDAVESAMSTSNCLSESLSQCPEIMQDEKCQEMLK